MQIAALRFLALLALPSARAFALAAPCLGPVAIARNQATMNALDASVAASAGVLLIAIVSGQLIISDAAGGSKRATPAFRSRDATAATAAAVTTALVAAALASLVFASSADAVVLLPQPKEQAEASAARARALRATPSYPLLEAQRNIEALLADREAFRTCVALGLPTGRLQMPATISQGAFLNLELVASNPAALRAAAQAYAVDASKANEYLAYAERAQMDQSAAEVTEYLDVAFSAAERCATSLQRILAQAPDAK